MSQCVDCGVCGPTDLRSHLPPLLLSLRGQLSLSGFYPASLQSSRSIPIDGLDQSSTTCFRYPVVCHRLATLHSAYLGHGQMPIELVATPSPVFEVMEVVFVKFTLPI